MPSSRITRRSFLGASAAAGAFMILPRRALGGPDAPSNRLQVAGVGAGGQAMADLGQISAHADIVALCDVDQQNAEKAYQRWPDARRYTDWRKMLDEEGNRIDAVVVACPDHVHAVAAAAAMQLGKHVYVEKPMAHNIAEVRRLMQLAKDTGVVTQMGNQGHSFPTVHRLKEWMEKQAIGPVREIFCWTNRPTWPQGMAEPLEAMAVPDTLDWDLWLGPAAVRPYNRGYLPKRWRGWWDFGTCALGDMGCHILDPPFHALNLGAPARVTAEHEDGTAQSGPTKSKVVFEFPERGEGFPACTLTWFDGGNPLERPAELESNKPMGDNDGGSLFIGDTGKAISGTYSNGARLLPNLRMEAWEKEHGKGAEDYSTRGHHHNWVMACKGEGQAVSRFDYAGPLTELVHLGNIAIRAGQPIEWDAENMRITNVPEANQYLSREYREGWG